jgi:hypothetical protein
MFEIPNELARASVRLEHSNFEFEICFGFRASNFGFSVWLWLRWGSLGFVDVTVC